MFPRQSCMQEPASMRVVRKAAKPSEALTRELLKSLVIAEAAWRTSAETIQLFRDAGGDKWMDLVLAKQRQLLHEAQLPASDLPFLQDTRRFDPDDHELHKCSVQRAANYLVEDPPLSLLQKDRRVLDAAIFAQPDAPALRLCDVVGRSATVVLTVSVT